MKKFIITTLFGLVGALAYNTSSSSEVDPHTYREENLRNLTDSQHQIDHWINYYIQKQINKINNSWGKKSDCRINPAKKKKKLISLTRKCLGGHWRTQCGGEITLYRRLKYKKYGALNETYEPETGQGKRVRTYITPSDSIYRDFGLIESPSLILVSKFHNTMGAHLKVAGNLVGSDKYTHFFNRGRKYFKYYYVGTSKDSGSIHKAIVKKYKNKYSQEEVLEISRRQREKYMIAQGKHSEESLFGAKSTGIASYGDLAANFAGLVFWNEFTGWGNDIRTLRPVPEKDIYVKCDQITGHFYQQRTFKSIDYINATWDEGMNCSVYQTQLQAQNVKSRVNQLFGNNSIHCPVSLEKLQKEGKKFFGRFYAQVVQEIPYQFIDKVITEEFGVDRIDHYGRYVGGLGGPKYKAYQTIPATEPIITERPNI